MVGVTIYYKALPADNNNYLKNELVSNEFFAVSGNWKVAEYLGEGVEYHGAEIKMEAQKDVESNIAKEIKEKYLKKELMINKNHVTAFYPPTELGYYCSDWDSLFLIYRQSSDIWHCVSLPPYFCASFKLKGNDDNLDIIMDDNGEVILVVKGHFFRLDRIE